MNEQDYLIAWGAYGIAALGCLLVWMRMTGWIWRWLREPLRVIVAVLLFSPIPLQTEQGSELFAPAIAATALDILFKSDTNAWRALADMALYCLIALCVWLLFAAIRWPIERWWQARHPKAAQRVEAPEDEPTLREVMERKQSRYQDEAETRIDGRGDRRLRIEPRL
ncbi:MFS transporter [Pseudomonas sp. LRF_L74]|uniref:MFS transporter n=1 Tax=Pseudomonas sp. LRF_L74 TaxID=3369422 RepID=UPI003F5F347F